VTYHPITCKQVEARKVNKQVQRLIETILENNPFETPQTISSFIKNELGILLGKTTVRYWMKRLGITRKKTSRFVSTSNIDEERLKFARDYSSLCHPNRVISIDESSFYFDMKPSYGYCKRSKRLRVPARPGGRTRFSLLLAVSNEQIIGWKLVKGSIDSIIFSQFIEVLDLKGRDTVLLDNASIHTCKLSQETMFVKGLTPWFLPAYTPEFQPIEHTFSTIKHYYRKLSSLKSYESDTTRFVFSHVKDAISLISAETLQNQFRICWERAANLIS
jgi:transposase